MTTEDIRVRFADTDTLGIVHHARYLEYAEIGRIGWLRARGVSIRDWIARGSQIVVVESGVRHHAPAFLDDVLSAETELGKVGAASIEFETRILRGADLLADVRIRLAHLVGGRVRRFDEDLRALFAARPTP